MEGEANVSRGNEGGATGRDEQCAADWRRDDGYWRCVKPAGHRWRHRLRPAVRPEPSGAPLRRDHGEVPRGA
jgi:hypothetical protein